MVVNLLDAAYACIDKNRFAQARALLETRACFGGTDYQNHLAIAYLAFAEFLLSGATPKLEEAILEGENVLQKREDVLEAHVILAQARATLALAGDTSSRRAATHHYERAKELAAARKLEPEAAYIATLEEEVDHAIRGMDKA